MRLIGKGGMGSVYKAIDLKHAAPVALKVARWPDKVSVQRFMREAEALSRLDHPAIVRYVAHGLAGSRRPYMAMEWLEGEDLGERLGRSALSVAETIMVGVRTAEALQAAHGLGILHRDLKPNNLFLVDGEVAKLKLLDFGLASINSLEGGMLALTRPGEMVGTPGFMAPEIARGEQDIDSRADLYSLGVVLFTCLTQKPPFLASHIVGTLAKLLFEAIPRVSELRADVPHELDRIIANLMAREPGERLPTAEMAISRLCRVPADAPVATRDRSRDEADHGDSRFWSVLVIGRHGDPIDESKLRELAHRHDAISARPGEGAAAAVFCTDRDLAEVVTRAARCAVDLRGSFAELPIAMATGRRARGDRAPIARLMTTMIQRAVSMWHPDNAMQSPALRLAAMASHPGRLEVVEIGAAKAPATAETVPPSVRTSRMPARRRLRGRPPARFRALVGRHRELTLSELLMDQWAAEKTARVVLVTGDAGVGKSRLRHEIESRLGSRGDGLQVWTGLGDCNLSRSPFSMLSRVIRNAMGIAERAVTGLQHQQLAERVSFIVPDSDAERVAVFLGELIGVHLASDHHPMLRTAASDARIMHEQMRQAWEDWLDAETAARPVLIVLDDAQWSDTPSLRFIAAALRRFSHRQLKVLALTNSETRDRLRELWAPYLTKEIALAPLSQRACERLATTSLPEDTPSSFISAVVDRSAGHALFLEELVRTTMHGELLDSLPATLDDAFRHNLGNLRPDERRLLQMASVLGRTFCLDDITAVAPAADRGRICELVGRLIEQEWLTRDWRSGATGDYEYGFASEALHRHLYDSIAPDERAHWHKRAGKWLAGLGAGDPLVIAEHLERGGIAARGTPWLCRAAQRTLMAGECKKAVVLAKRAMAHGAASMTLGRMSLLQAEAYNWVGDHAAAYLCGCNAMDLLPAGSSQWASAAQNVVWAATVIGRFSELETIVQALVNHAGEAPDEPYTLALARCATRLAASDRYTAAQLIKTFIDDCLRVHQMGPVLAATVSQLHGVLAGLDGRSDEAAESMMRAATYWKEVGDLHNSCISQGSAGVKMRELGEYEQAAAALRKSISAAREAGIEQVLHLHARDLAVTMARNGDVQTAATLFPGSLETTSPQVRALNRVYRAQLRLLCGELAAALHETERALELVQDGEFTKVEAFALAVRAQILLAQGRYGDALGAATMGMHLVESLGALDEGDALLRLVHAEALHAAGDRDAACDAIAAARSHLLRRARHIKDPLRRATFLDRVTEHARTILLSDAWSDPTPV